MKFKVLRKFVELKRWFFRLESPVSYLLATLFMIIGWGANLYLIGATATGTTFGSWTTAGFLLLTSNLIVMGMKTTLGIVPFIFLYNLRRLVNAPIHYNNGHGGLVDGSKFLIWTQHKIGREKIFNVQEMVERFESWILEKVQRRPKSKALILTTAVIFLMALPMWGGRFLNLFGALEYLFTRKITAIGAVIGTTIGSILLVLALKGGIV